MATPVQILKGTYRWNDTLTRIPIDEPMGLDFESTVVDGETTTTFTFNRLQNSGNYIQFYVTKVNNSTEDSRVDTFINVYNLSTNRWEWELQDFTVIYPMTYDETLGNWFNNNATAISVEPEPDEPEEPDTPTEDSIKAKIQSLIAKANTTTGKSDADLTKVVLSLVAGYGQGGGSCNLNHIIEVDALPTENIDENVLYKMGDSYYKYSLAFNDLLISYGGTPGSYVEILELEGISVELYYVKTRPTDNIEISTQEMFHMYYVEDEDNILAYGDFEGSGINTWMSFSDEIEYRGAITDISQVTSAGFYALVENGWKEYLAPEGSITIVANGTFDVTEKAEVVVNIPDSPLPIEVTSTSDMDALKSTAENGSVYKYTGANTTNHWATSFYANGILYVVKDGAFKTLAPDVEIKYGNFLTFSSPNSFRVRAGKTWDGVIEYSTDAISWNEWSGESITSVGNVLYLRGTGNTYITGEGSNSTSAWSIIGTNVSCNGNIETLLDYEAVANGEHPVMESYCYYYMFYNCTSLISAPDLLAESIRYCSYSNMFCNCTNLITAPTVLPATSVSIHGCTSMFEGCTSLTTAPALPATSLNQSSYNGMFKNCTGLITAPTVLPATLLAISCYQCMFEGCTSLTTAPALPATVTSASCYSSMFKNCTSLTTIPALIDVMEFEYSCSNMFNGCTNVKIAASQTDEYKTAYIIPYRSDSAGSMFEGTGGTFTGTPSTNTTYYTSNPVISVV